MEVNGLRSQDEKIHFKELINLEAYILLHISDGLEMKALEISKGSLAVNQVFLEINLELPLSVKSHHIPKENLHSCSKKMHPTHPIPNPAQC